MAVLVTFSLASLATGARGGTLGSGLRTTVQVASMPFLLVFHGVEGGASYVKGLVLDYDEARGAAHELQLEFTALRQSLAGRDEALAENARLRTMLNFERTQTQYKLAPAQVLQHSRGILTIDLGARHGVRPSMCVIAPDGIIGMITQVGPFSSSVVTLQSSECRVDAMVRHSRVRGRVHGLGNDLNGLCRMQYIDLKDDVLEGDEIVTSPDSVFPSGFPIGRVVGSSRRGQLAQSVDVLPAADPFRLDEVFVLLSADPEVTDFQGAPLVEETARVALTLIDGRSIQERFAP